MKKIFLVSLSILLVALMVVGGTLAYLTVDAPAFSNIVTVGDVNIELTETVNVIGSGDVVETADGATYSGVMPGDKLQKEVTVKNTGTKTAYVRVDVNLNNALLFNKAIDSVYEAKYGENAPEVQAMYDYIFDGWGLRYTKVDDEGNALGMRLTITGDDMPEHVMQVDSVKTISEYTNAYADNWNENSSVVIKNGKYPGYYSQNMNDYEIHYAYYMLLEAGESTTLFNGFNVPAEFNKAQLDMFNNLHIDVTASAIQADNIPSLEAYGSEAHAKVAFAILAGDPYPALDAWEDVADTSWYDASATTFILDSAEDVAGLSQLVYSGNNLSGKTVKLEANIDLGGKLWTPIGRMINTSGAGENSTFKGTFDGQGYTIYNLNVNTVNDGTDDNNKGAGLFGAITGEIKNLTVKNAKVETAHWAGVIAGSIEGSISNCHVENATLVCLPELIGAEWDNGDKAGAIVGYATKGTISDCTVKNVNITAYRDMGAIVGASYNNVVNCAVENVKLTKDNTYDYKGAADDTTVNSYVGTVYGGATVDATGDVVITNAVSYEASDATDISNALESGAENVVITLEDKAEIKMPSSSTSADITIAGTKDTVLDMTWGAYLESANVTVEGVTIKCSTGYVTSNGTTFGSDYAALYSKNVTYRNCTFDGPFRLGRDGATFENCTFDLEGVNDYVWTYGNSATFKGCTFNTSGKALLIYSDGNGEVPNVSVTGCVFNADASAKAGAIANQACAAIEIDNYGCGVNLTISGNTVDTEFSGEWRIKSYDSNKDDIFVNGVEYTSIALDGKKMTIDSNKNVTVVE